MCEEPFEDGVESNMLFAVMRAVVVILKRPPSCPWRLTDQHCTVCVYVCVLVLGDSASLLRSTESEAAGAADADRLFSRQGQLGHRKGENE